MWCIIIHFPYGVLLLLSYQGATLEMQRMLRFSHKGDGRCDMSQVNRKQRITSWKYDPLFEGLFHRTTETVTDTFKKSHLCVVDVLPPTTTTTIFQYV